jgi:predicted NAD/FAD-binding protein
VAAVWSCAPGAGGSATYVRAIAEHVHEVRVGTPVRSVTRVAGGLHVCAGDAAPRRFDAAVIATHPDQALQLLAEPTDAQRTVLGAIPYSINHAQLHTDESLLPHRRRGRASWNYGATADTDGVLVTYDHPLCTLESVAAQPLLPTIDDDQLVFAGAYHGWGFHEDGAASGLRAAQRLGARWGAERTLESVPC